MTIFWFSDLKFYSVPVSLTTKFYSISVSPTIVLHFGIPDNQILLNFDFADNCFGLLWGGEAKQEPVQRFHSSNWGTLGLPPQNEEHYFTVHCTLNTVYCTLYTALCFYYGLCLKGKPWSCGHHVGTWLTKWTDKNQKSSPGPNGITFEMLHQLTALHKPLATLYNKVLQHGTSPATWGESIIKLCHKKGPANTQPIFAQLHFQTLQLKHSI